MEDKNLEQRNSELRPKGKLLRNSSIFIMVTSLLIFIAILPVFVNNLADIVSPSPTDSWAKLGFAISLFLLSTPCLSLIAAICGLRYVFGKFRSNLESCLVFSLLSLVGYSIDIYTFGIGIGNMFSNFSLDGTNTKTQIIFIITAISLTCLPLIIYMFGCCQEKLGKGFFINFMKSHKTITTATIALAAIVIIIILTTIGNHYYSLNHYTTKIEVNSSSLPTYRDFENELNNRNIKVGERSNSELTTSDTISASDADYEYEYRFSTTGVEGFVDENSDKGYPLFIYDGYTSLIEKSSQTAKYYNKGPEDWWISWYIYDVNGQIYAAIGEESKLNTVRRDDLFNTQYKMVVAENDKITTYNRKGNYFSYGGGILDTKTKPSMASVPTIKDVADSSCAKITVVDRVDAETLDNIAKQIARGR